MGVLKLKHPLSIGKTTLDKLVFRDHSIAEDYLAFDLRGGVAQNHALIASMAGTDEAIVKQLHGADYRAAVKIVDALIAADNDDGEDIGKK